MSTLANAAGLRTRTCGHRMIDGIQVFRYTCRGRKFAFVIGDNVAMVCRNIVLMILTTRSRETGKSTTIPSAYRTDAEGSQCEIATNRLVDLEGENSWLNETNRLSIYTENTFAFFADGDCGCGYFSIVCSIISILMHGIVDRLRRPACMLFSISSTLYLSLSLSIAFPCFACSCPSLLLHFLSFHLLQQHACRATAE